MSILFGLYLLSVAESEVFTCVNVKIILGFWGQLDSNPDISCADVVKSFPGMASRHPG